MESECFLNPFVFKECDIQSYIHNEYIYYQGKSARIKANEGVKAGSHNSSCGTSEIERQRRLFSNFRKASFYLRSNPQKVKETIKAVVRNLAKAAFVTYDYEFQHNWGIFAEIMKRRPEWKFANNFESNDNFSIRETAYSFTSGLHERFQKRFEGRFKVILSSGFYGLWRRWERIKFSMSGLRHDDKKLEPTTGSPGDPMSFENSATFWVFWAQPLAWLGTLAVFSVEVTCSLMSWNAVERVYAAAVKKYADMRSCARKVAHGLRAALETVWFWTPICAAAVCTCISRVAKQRKIITKKCNSCFFMLYSSPFFSMSHFLISVVIYCRTPSQLY